MSPHRQATLEDFLREMFPEEWLKQTAKETGLIVLELKIDPVTIFWVLTLSFGVRMQRTLASLKRDYGKEANKSKATAVGTIIPLPNLLSFFISVLFMA